jgi:tryptophanyl-tRNA synthetase
MIYKLEIVIAFHTPLNEDVQRTKEQARKALVESTKIIEKIGFQINYTKLFEYQKLLHNDKYIEIHRTKEEEDQARRREKHIAYDSIRRNLNSIQEQLEKAQQELEKAQQELET